MLRRSAAYILLFLFALASYARGEDVIGEPDRLAEEFVTVSLVVCEPYEVLYSSLGHAALHLQCPTYDLDYIFTYESESVKQKFWTFLKGDLKMGMYAFPTPLFLEMYRIAGRGVKEYKMNLTPIQDQQLWRVMDNMQTAGMTLPYDYFRRGCAKSVVMVVNKAMGGNGIHYAPWSEKYTDHTMRELCCDFVTNAPWNEFVSYFLVGNKADKDYPCEQKLIVPTDLVEVWQQAILDNGKPVLESEPNILLEQSELREATWCTPVLVCIILLLLALGSLATEWTNNKSLHIAGTVVDYLVLTIATALGIVMTYLICFSSLPCTEWNWLIIPFNVLPAIGWYWRKYWALPFVGILLVWMIIMIAWPHRLVDLAHVLLVLSWTVILAKQGVSILKRK